MQGPAQRWAGAAGASTSHHLMALTGGDLDMTQQRASIVIVASSILPGTGIQQKISMSFAVSYMLQVACLSMLKVALL